MRTSPSGVHFEVGSLNEIDEGQTAGIGGYQTGGLSDTHASRFTIDEPTADDGAIVVCTG
jgi:hypothetical protein